MDELNKPMIAASIRDLAISGIRRNPWSIADLDVANAESNRVIERMVNSIT